MTLGRGVAGASLADLAAAPEELRRRDHGGAVAGDDHGAAEGSIRALDRQRGERQLQIISDVLAIASQNVLVWPDDTLNDHRRACLARNFVDRSGQVAAAGVSR
jgi:hypothetical protein